MHRWWRQSTANSMPMIIGRSGHTLQCGLYLLRPSCIYCFFKRPFFYGLLFSGGERIMSRPGHSVSKILSYFVEVIVRFSPNLASGFVYHPIRRIRSHFEPSSPPLKLCQKRVQNWKMQIENYWFIGLLLQIVGDIIYSIEGPFNQLWTSKIHSISDIASSFPYLGY